MYLLIDNYDSFTYNLYQYFIEVGCGEMVVRRNDRIDIGAIEKMNPEGIVISPGPGRPEGAGVCVDCIKRFAGKIPILGVCLGHQAIGYAFGARITRASRIVHGKAEEITMDGRGLFRNIPKRARFTRYHSLVIDDRTMPDDFEITATADDGEIMGIRHTEYPVEGVQFHPESFASECGKKILANFLHYRRDSFDIRASLSKLQSGTDLSRDEAVRFMEELTDGELTDAQISAVLTALNMKRITPEELAGCASVLNKRKLRIHFEKPLLDTCGTGGDETGSFNISSLSAVTAAACGAYVAKHGNRGVSSRSGSADFYRMLDIPVDLGPERAVELLEKTGFTFLFAPAFHGSMRYAAGVRRDLGVKTVMNLLGPLVNPADAAHQLIGVFSDEYLHTVAEAAHLLGKTRVLVVHSTDGFDEMSICAPTVIVEIAENGSEREYRFDPLSLGIKGYTQEELAGGDPAENARLASEIVENRGRPALLEAVSLNAGAALYIYGGAESIEEGYNRAKQALVSGAVRDKIEEIRQTSKVPEGVT
jgi:anthranilate synthase/phosphoribosyltransferase